MGQVKPDKYHVPLLMGGGCPYINPLIHLGYLDGDGGANEDDEVVVLQGDHLLAGPVTVVRFQDTYYVDTCRGGQ